MQIQSVIILFIIILLLTFIHELGHFIVARLCNVPVASFAIGFGPNLLCYKDKRGTKWCWNLIPLGGYVEMSNDGNETDAMLSINPFKRMLVSFGGPFVNIMFFFFGGCLFYYFSGVDVNVYRYNYKIYYVSTSQQYVLYEGLDKNTALSDKHILKEIITDGHKEDTLLRKTLSLTNSIKMCKYRIVGMTKKIIQIFTSWKELKNIKSIVMAQKAIHSTLIKPQSFSETLREMIFTLLIYSLSLGLFNLLPIIGLDGFWVLMSFINIFWRPKIDTQRKLIMFINNGTILVFVIFGLLICKDVFFLLKEYLGF